MRVTLKGSLMGVSAVVLLAGFLIGTNSLHAVPPGAPKSKEPVARFTLQGSQQAGPFVESTGFEAPEWTAGHSLCGPEYTPFCPAVSPFANACVANDPAGNVNCCVGDPNATTGWYMSASAQHCRQPHISTVNPAAGGGTQHMRFERDANGGNPPGAIGLGGAARLSFFDTSVGLQPVGPTNISFDVAVSSTFGANWLFQGQTLSSDGTAVVFYFYNQGQLYAYNGQGAYAYAGPWAYGGVYKKAEVSINPCTNSLVYRYDGNVVLSTTAEDYTYIDQILVLNDNGGEIVDIDNVVITHGEACPVVCGDGVVGPTESCEPGVDEVACPGRCIAPGLEGECGCSPICTFEAPCPLANGANGPYLTSTGFYTFVADTNHNSLHTCGADFDTLIQVYLLSDLSAPLRSNDDCDNGSCCGADSDPSAPCYDPGGAVDAPFPSCTCADTTIGETYLVWIPHTSGADPPVGSTTPVSLSKKFECNVAWANGACCDRNNGTCTDDVAQSACSGQNQVYTHNKLCSSVTCTEATGACCDASPGLGGACTDGVLHGACSGAQQTWSKDTACSAVTCAEATGACCNTLAGSCSTTLLGACQGSQRTWTKGVSCAAAGCSAVQGACCNHDDGSCTSTTQAGCSCEKCEWTKLADCANVSCDPNFEPIPTVSEWGLAIMTLLLLTGAKIYFGRRQAASA